METGQGYHRPRHMPAAAQAQRRPQNGWANLVGMGYDPAVAPLAASMPEPTEVKVTVGNKHMMADEGIAVPAAIDDHMRKMEVCTATACCTSSQMSHASLMHTPHSERLCSTDCHVSTMQL